MRQWSQREIEALLSHGADLAELPEPTTKGSIIVNPATFHIQPDDIDADRHLFN